MNLQACRVLHRSLASLATAEAFSYAPNLTLWPRFFSPREQCVLLGASLQRLDSNETRQSRRRMKTYKSTQPPTSAEPSPQDCFLPDQYYDFQEGHFDGVIRQYREMHLSSWPESESPDLVAVLMRLYSLCPTEDTQTHLIHLATLGEILPHVDNASASGSWIMGVSLGAERLLQMDGPTQDHESLRISLPSGSVYLQRDYMRYNYRHSILRSKLSDAVHVGQRLSIIIRDRPLVELLHGRNS
ncbi:Alpha-ketoglutarate-dependent dioxygenase alkB 7, mitochondrial [Hypsizygus marmoreus]|uniref:Alpha-ketoglutarate-dependent dioxygenase alkB 7, mitochondrial n=1 Tax=Hypsizygus marmoreus TaxID=39966 RepID=A0A369JGD4_HYPMA|nr:Alpha-ketoglutarate-dependent dioxygenase alkB 7, mitochondrial [Hypsizygus marmoreus]